MRRPAPSMAETLRFDLLARGIASVPLSICEAIIARLAERSAGSVAQVLREARRFFANDPTRMPPSAMLARINDALATLDQPQPVATPAFDALAAKVIDRISERYNKLAASPLGMATAWERKASGGKPLLYGGKRGLLASGTIATWDEFDLIADVINNLPTLLAACSVSRPHRKSEGEQ